MAGWHARLAGLAFCLTAAAAQSAEPQSPARGNPVLTATANGIRDDNHARDITLRRLDVAVELRGTVAETTVTAAFTSTAREPLEGDFKLQLPAGAVITGYALDIDGRMTDGVLIDRPKAKSVYEDRIRRNVDPGLAEVSGDNVFSTRVFPIAPERGRTIRVKFVTTAGRDGAIRLPFVSDAIAEGWSVRVHAMGGTPAPQLAGPAGVAEANPVADGSMAIASGKGALGGGFTIRTTGGDGLVSRHRNGERFVQLGGMLPPAARDARPARVRIYWDRSRSRLDDDLAGEIDLLGAYLTAVRPGTTELVAFNSSGTQRVIVATPAQAAAWLKALRYRGATSFAPIAADGAAADRCLLFSDGQPTIDRATDFSPVCRLDAVASAPDADRAWLTHVAATHGGASFALGTGRQDRDRVLAALRAAPSGVIGVASDAGKPLDFVPIDAPAGKWRVLARAPGSGGVIVRLAGAAPVRRQIGGPEATFDGEGALIARDRLATLGATQDRAAFVALSRKFGIASPSLSFVVLETPRDYVTADVAPPADYPPEARAAYAEAKRDADSSAKAARDEWFDDVLERWRKQVAWWNTRFDPTRRQRPHKGRSEVPPPAVMEPVPVPAPPPPPSPEPPSADSAREESSPDVVITATRRPSPAQNSPVPVTTVTSDQLDRRGISTVQNSLQSLASNNGASASGAKIEIDAWQPDRPYIKVFDATPGNFDALFVREEAKSGGIPAFYFDTAEWLRKHGRTADAVEMVMSAIDLTTANEVTLSIVADRLERYGALDRAVELRERAAVLDPARPQPKRFLALALAKRATARMTTNRAGARADLAHAIKLLGEIALTPWENDWDGIEIVSLVEANALIPQLQRLGGTPALDKRLIALLDTDVRIVMDWTTDATDLDLWVDEPTGERSIYSNPLTAIGGQLSNDMTAGYGPEQYLLRRAPAGTYTIRSNVFAADTLDPNGASFLTVHLFRDFGRPTQREEVVDVELTRESAGRGNDDDRMIGRIVVPRR